MSILRGHGMSVFYSNPDPVVDDKRSQDRILSMLENQFPQSIVFGVKDPRIVLMIDAYRAALDRFGAEVKIIDLRRAASSSSSSMSGGPWMRRQQYDAVAVHAMYEARLDRIDGDKVKVRFNDLIERPRDVIGSLCEFIGLEYNPEVESFVDRRLVHHGGLSDV
jgi:hypothetical protein